MLATDKLEPAVAQEMLRAAIRRGRTQWWTALTDDPPMPSPHLLHHWIESDLHARARFLIKQLWNSIDPVPDDCLTILDFTSGTTYAQLVRRLRSDVEDRPKKVGRPPLYGESMPLLHVNIPAPLLNALNARCRERGIPKAEAVREALAAWLGIAPQHGEEVLRGNNDAAQTDRAATDGGGEPQAGHGTR